MRFILSECVVVSVAVVAMNGFTYFHMVMSMSMKSITMRRPYIYTGPMFIVYIMLPCVKYRLHVELIDSVKIIIYDGAMDNVCIGSLHRTAASSVSTNSNDINS